MRPAWAPKAHETKLRRHPNASVFPTTLPCSPDCPPGASADATSPRGLLLAAELSPLMDLCGAAAASSQQAQQAQQAPDEDDLAADMAGLAAAAQDPAAAGRLARDSAEAASAAAAAASGAQRAQRQHEFGDSPLLDTPEGEQGVAGLGAGDVVV